MRAPRLPGRLGCALLVMALGSACGEPATSRVSQRTAIAAVTEPLVDPGQVVVVRADRSIAAVSSAGEETAELGVVPAEAGEPDAVAASADGRLVLVSVVRDEDDDPGVCDAAVLQVLPDGRLRQLAAGAAVALTTDGSRLAYFRYAQTSGYCRRTDLVVRDLTDGAESVLPVPGEALAGATPPEWPVSWSPDAEQIAHVNRGGAVVTTVSTGRTRALDADPGTRALAPAWLSDGRLVALHGCCIGGASIRVNGAPEPLFAVPGPTRSFRPGRDGFGAWFTVEEQGLHHWDGSVTRPLHGDALLTSG